MLPACPCPSTCWPAGGRLKVQRLGGGGCSSHLSSLPAQPRGLGEGVGSKDKSLSASLGHECNLFFCGFCGFSIAVLRMAGVQKSCLKRSNRGPLPLPLLSSLTAGVPLLGVVFLRRSASREAQGTQHPNEIHGPLLGTQATALRPLHLAAKPLSNPGMCFLQAPPPLISKGNSLSVPPRTEERRAEYSPA